MGDHADSSGFTGALAARAAGLRFEDLPLDLIERARQCFLDWLGVALAGSSDEAVLLLRDELLDLSGHPSAGASVIGHRHRLPVADSALVNGTAGHVLDFDDVNRAMTGHPTAPVLPAVLALAEHTGAAGSTAIAAFIAGYETECRLGAAFGREHYQRGFHTTGTLGAVGAAAACARLLGLGARRTAVALGLAATQAAGLKPMFGTMGKPLHGGRAASVGLLSAVLAARGYDGHPSLIEVEQGFAETHTETFDASRGLDDPPLGWYLRSNLFKYHASCFQTQSPVEGLIRLRAAERFSPDDVRSVVIHANPLQMDVCAISEPDNGLAIKFSLCHSAAFALAGVDTSNPNSFSDAACRDPHLVDLRSRVSLVPDGSSDHPTLVEVELHDGRTVRTAHDVSTPEPDLSLQRHRLEEKFHSLSTPILGKDGADRLLACVATVEEGGISELLDATRAQ
jgi:2-methylcitrate dehydratase PrpD